MRLKCPPVTKFVGIVKEVSWTDSGGSLTLLAKSTQNHSEDISVPIQHYNTAAELRRLRNLKVELTFEHGRIIEIRKIPTAQVDLE
ncbi:MAG: hypothetical protein ACE5KO_01795 [Candidatus Bathyarchaeia archaeon]